MLLLAVAVCFTTGCEILGFFSQVVAGGEKRVTVTAAYRGLANRSFAVLVAPDDYALGRHPQVVDRVSRCVTTAVAAAVDATRPMDPEQIVTFQHDNPGWVTSPPGDLIERLQVDRLLIVWLSDYALHEPGNAHVWRGVVAAKIDVIEAEAPNPNNAVYRTDVRAIFPADNSIGVFNAKDRDIEFGMLKNFGDSVANLFVDHEVVQK